MNKYEITKDLYYTDLTNKENLNSKISIPIAVETILIGALMYYIQLIPELPNKTWVGIFEIILFIFTVSSVTSIIITIITYIGTSYKYITSDIVIDIYNNFEEYYNNNYDQYYSSSKKTKEELINIDVENQIVEIMNDCSQWNINQNANKSNRIRFNAVLIGISLITAFILQTILIFYK